MEIEKEQHIIKLSENNCSISLDISYQCNNNPKPVVVYTHGFKGFKDWGHFPLIADFFAKRNYVFVKINFSMNGTSPDRLCDFVDLEAFGKNTISQELHDIDQVINYIKGLANPEFNTSRMALLGHSRGGATCHIKALENESIKSVASWASVIALRERYASTDLELWKKDGVKYVFNGRTNQSMPLYYSLAEDIINHSTRFDLRKRLSETTKPTLLLHCEKDTVVEPQELDLVSNDNPLIIKHVVKDGDHTFGGKHPYSEQQLPKASLEACEHTHKFFQQYL